MTKLKLHLELRDAHGRLHASSLEITVSEVIETSGEEVPPSAPPSLPPREAARPVLQLVREAA